MDLKLRMPNLCRDENDGEGQLGERVDVVSQSFNSSVLSLCVQGIFEFEEAIGDISRYKKAFANAILSSNPLFSCIMKADDRGVMRWQKTAVNTDNHTFIVEFPPGKESYDAVVDEYISKLTLTPLDQSRPLWEIHFLNYKTNKAGATMVVKIHHSLGDGISLMSALFSIFRRVDNPHLPPSFPTPKRNITSTSSDITVAKFLPRLSYMMLVLWYTLVDIISCLLRMIRWIDDSKLPIRGPRGVENMPVALVSATFPLKDIKQIKNSVGGTVNDVMTGIIFSGMQRYLQMSLSAVGEHGLQDAYKRRFEQPKDAVIKQLKNSKLTALSMINTRAMAGLQNMEEMLKPKAQVPWGNHFGFLPVQVPLMGKLENPLDIVKMAKQRIDRHKISLGVFLVAKLPRLIAMLKGQQALSRYLYNTLSNTTMMLSNMIGPMEKVAIYGNPIKRFSFFVTGLPQTLGVFIVSYMDSVLVQVHAHKDYVDADILVKCFIEAMEEIKKSQFHYGI
eukprot:PITA_32564